MCDRYETFTVVIPELGYTGLHYVPDHGYGSVSLGLIGAIRDAVGALISNQSKHATMRAGFTACLTNLNSMYDSEPKYIKARVNIHLGYFEVEELDRS